MTFANVSAAVPFLCLSNTIHRFAAGALYYPLSRTRRLSPFVFWGPGASLFHVSAGSREAAAGQGVPLDDCWKFTFSWGVGFQYRFQGRLRVGFQAGQAISGLPDFGLPTSQGPASAGYRPKGFLKQWLVGLSLGFHWD